MLVRGKETGSLVTVLQTHKSRPQGSWVIAEEMILKIRNLERHQTNYFKIVFDFSTSSAEQQSKTTVSNMKILNSSIDVIQPKNPAGFHHLLLYL